jgi:hypothetical protein
LNTDTGSVEVSPQLRDKSIQVLGTFGASGNCRIEGSNDAGTTWATLNDPQGNVLDFGAAKIEQLLESPNMIRPNITAGDGTTNLTVVLISSGNR